MDNQEIFNQIRELQKQRTSLKEQDTALVVQIMELKDKLSLKSIKKGYYTNNGLFCKVYDIKKDIVLVYELDTNELYVTEEVYGYESFKNTYRKECTKEEYDNALDEIVKHFKG